MALAVLIDCVQPAQAITPTVVAPNSATNTEGGSDNAVPFDTNGSTRYQQLFASSQFSILGGAGGFITQIVFRPEGTNGNAFNRILPDIQINLSTVNIADDGLSSTFASNVGANDTVVYGRGALSLSSSFFLSAAFFCLKRPKFTPCRQHKSIVLKK